MFLLYCRLVSVPSGVVGSGTSSGWDRVSGRRGETESWSVRQVDGRVGETRVTDDRITSPGPVSSSVTGSTLLHSYPSFRRPVLRLPTDPTQSVGSLSLRKIRLVPPNRRLFLVQFLGPLRQKSQKKKGVIGFVHYFVVWPNKLSLWHTDTTSGPKPLLKGCRRRVPGELKSGPGLQ